MPEKEIILKHFNDISTKYDENNKKVGSTTGVELEKFVLDKKKEIDSLYSK